MEIRKKVAEIINEIGNETVGEEYELNLFDAGILSSLTVMQIIGDIEDTFDIEIDLDDVNQKNFSTIQNIAAMIEKYMKQ